MPAMRPFLVPAISALNYTLGGPKITLDYGVFQGSAVGNLSTFLGVPYSQPVTRFELPKPPTTLQGLQDATAFGPACPQQAMNPPELPDFSSSFFAHKDSSISEDCLFLNVITPSSSTAASKLPVFVWFHGGGFEIGSARGKMTWPLVERSMATDQPIVLVTPQYRVSAFGFLGGTQVGEAGISNLGLRDQIAALEWVQANIAAFGGDPARVVISGGSAGAISASLLLLDNKRFEQTALFSGAFMVSGAPPKLSSLAAGQPSYDALVADNGCNSADDTLACLKAVPFEQFMESVNRTPNLFWYSSLMNVWRPRVDGEVLVTDPLVSVMRGQYAKVPIITGTCEDEGTVFSMSTLNITTNEQFEEYIHSNYLPHATPAQVKRIAELYPQDPAQGSPFDTGDANAITPQYKRLASFQGDYIFTGSRRFLLQQAAKTQPAWSWVNKRDKGTPTYGASHGSDFPVWFPEAYDSDDFSGVDMMLNFVNTLNPNHHSHGIKSASGGVSWPTWDTPSPSGGETSLLIFSDEGLVEVEAEEFRAEAIGYLFELLLKQAEVEEADGEWVLVD
ncbi:sterol esterase [Roridomyces roridus]|uniref:Carboxylic ester hydrolase n=1 Tax=Roridomyces roridus TaxID=1738132 RepID=A0AAD7G222_9AGAR|nr:sterol esterase [Roridomyces roridus]